MGEHDLQMLHDFHKQQQQYLTMKYNTQSQNITQATAIPAIVGIARLPAYESLFKL
jgi:hypothetical protein